MARSFNGSSDKATASLPSLTDFSISVRLKPNSTPSGTQSVVAWDNYPSSPRNYLVIQQSTAGSSGNINVDVGVAGTGGSSVVGAATLSSGTWYQMGASRASTTCKAWKDGAQIGSSWTVGSGSFTPSAFRFGCHNFNSSDQEFAPVTIAEGGLWSVELTVAEWAALAKGVSPKLIRPQSLVACWPLIGRASPEPDLRGGYNLTLTGTSQADHPRVYSPGRRRTVFVPGAGGGEISGSASVTLGALTLSATGTLAIAGAADVTLDPLTLSATGTVAITGALDATLDALTITATGALALAGAVDVTLGSLSLTSTGAVAITGAVDAALDPLTLTSAGALAIAGAVDVTLGDLVVTATGEVAITGSASITLDTLTLASSGALAITGATAATLDALTLTSAGALSDGPTGSVSVTLGALTLSATGALALAGSTAATLGSLTLVSTGSVAVTGVLSVTFGTLTLSATGTIIDGATGLHAERTYLVATDSRRAALVATQARRVSLIATDSRRTALVANLRV